MIAWPAATTSHRKQGPHHCRSGNRTLPRQEYPCKKSTMRATATAPARAARCYCRPRGRDLRGHGAESSRVFPFKSENQALMREESLLMQNVNCESESDITSPCSEVGTLPAERARPAHYGRRARASSFAQSESRTSPREESLPMQHVINHKTARGSRSEERHIAGRESTTCAKERRNAGSAGGTSKSSNAGSAGGPAEQGASREPTRCESQEGKEWRHKFRQ